jgi:flagellar biosynthetic protein FliP
MTYNKLMRQIPLFMILLSFNTSYASNLLNQANLPLQTPLLIMGGLSFLSFLPFILITLTAFTRILIVLSLLRTAIGLQQSPPNLVIATLSLILTCYTLIPFGHYLYEKIYLPYTHHEISEQVAMTKSFIPLKIFLKKHVTDASIVYFYQKFQQSSSLPIQKDDFIILLPSFLIHELTTAFKIGLIILLPFLLIDIVVSVILMVLGLVMIPPSTISLPIKLFIFVISQGWQLISEALIESV